MLVLQYRRKGLDLSVSMPQSGMIKICGAASSTRKTRTMFFISEGESNVVRRSVIGWMPWAMVGRRRLR